MTIEKKLQDHILEKYDSVNQFCQDSGISSGTIFSVFKRGINKTSTTTIMRICKTLKISPDALACGKIQEAEIENEADTIYLSQLLQSLESKNVIYKGNILTKEQKKAIAFASKIALQMVLHENENGGEDGECSSI